MSATPTSASPDTAAMIEHFDVVIVGAGITGLAAGYHLGQQCPDKSFVILESDETYGGTWHKHNYPGIRSDSDLYTFGFRFKPWVGSPIATADCILKYLGEVIEENDLAQHIRYGLRIMNASWSSADNLWTVVAKHTITGEEQSFTTGFLWMGTGYYRHDEGYTPEWPGAGDFAGRFVHPQNWSNDLDLTRKKVVVIGSGATAATLIPAIADRCGHVTMLQRSPGYYVPGHNRLDLADAVRELEVDERWVHEIARRKVVRDKMKFQRLCDEKPEQVKKHLLADVSAIIGPELTAQHFTPRYEPGLQRICFVPDGDLFHAMVDGKASVVTDEIEMFTNDGIRLKSGQMLPADVVITATGFNLNLLGDIGFTVDGEPVDFAQTVMYRGMLFTGVPNMAWVMGYFRLVSYTLRVEVVADFICRLLNHMTDKGAKKMAVALRPEDADMQLSRFIDPAIFNPGYAERGLHLWPKRGNKPEWEHSQSYPRDMDEFPGIDLDDATFVYDDSKSETPGRSHLHPRADVCDGETALPIVIPTKIASF